VAATLSRDVERAALTFDDLAALNVDVGELPSGWSATASSNSLDRSTPR
jgi:hypothetical protein